MTNEQKLSTTGRLSTEQCTHAFKVEIVLFILSCCVCHQLGDWRHLSSGLGLCCLGGLCSTHAKPIKPVVGIIK